MNGFGMIALRSLLLGFKKAKHKPVEEKAKPKLLETNIGDGILTKEFEKLQEQRRKGRE